MIDQRLPGCPAASPPPPIKGFTNIEESSNWLVLTLSSVDDVL
jgi:hypothetical protein